MKAGFMRFNYTLASMSESATMTRAGARAHRPLAVRSRLFKSRSLAADAVSGGKVHINHERVKPSHAGCSRAIP